MRRASCVGLLALTSLSIACENDSVAFKRGYSEGAKQSTESAYQLGHEAGYKAGFEIARPGSPLALTGAALHLYRGLVVAGLLTLVLSLVVAAISLFIHSNHGTERLGKSLLSMFGGVVALLCVLLMRASTIAVDLLLAPGGSIRERLVFVLVAAIGMHGLLEVLFRICASSVHRPWLEACSMAVIAALLTLLIPACYFFLGEVPEVANYAGANLFLGMLLGGLYWLARAALNHRFLIPRVSQVMWYRQRVDGSRIGPYT